MATVAQQTPTITPTAAPTGTPSVVEQSLQQAYENAATSGALSGTTSSTLKQDAPVGWTPQLVGRLSLGISVFALLCLTLITVLLWRRRNADQILRTFGILIIVFASVFLVIAGYSDTQITPVIGLLGTIAGYLLGRRIEPPTSEADRRGQREE